MHACIYIYTLNSNTRKLSSAKAECYRNTMRITPFYASYEQVRMVGCYVFVCTYECMYVCICIYIYICMYVCMCVGMSRRVQLHTKNVHLHDMSMFAYIHVFILFWESLHPTLYTKKWECLVSWALNTTSVRICAWYAHVCIHTRICTKILLPCTLLMRQL